MIMSLLNEFTTGTSDLMIEIEEVDIGLGIVEVDLIVGPGFLFT
jgi:hypothetical protein